jgi:hypothetical protein
MLSNSLSQGGNEPTSSLVPLADHPFFIVTPPYTRVSAGVTVLHLLCHYLNRLGNEAFIVHYPPETAPISTLPSYANLQVQREFPGGMLAPLITQDVLDFYDERKLTPIVIYPEVYDNPLQASFFARYILNYPGKLNQKYAEVEDLAFAYTRILADHCSSEYPDRASIEDVLFVPTSDLSFWNTTGAAGERKGTCYYAGKLVDILGSAPSDIPPDGVEILRDSRMSRQQIRDLFWGCEAFYCYEDSALAIEAQLCGCPVVFVPNSHFSGVPLASRELGWDGSCRLDEPDGLQRAKASVGKFEGTIRERMALVIPQIAKLATRLKSLAAAEEYKGSITYDVEPRLIFLDRPKDSEPREETVPESARSAAHASRLKSFSRFIRSATATLTGKFQAGGLSGAARSAALGIRKHGIRGSVRLLSGSESKHGGASQHTHPKL